MDRTDIIIGHVKDLIDKYANDEQTKKKFKEKVEETFFSNGEDESDYYPEISIWRKEMPPITRNNVSIFLDTNNRLIIEVTGTCDQTLNTLYASSLTNKLVDELYDIPEIIQLNPTYIGNGDGDEGCLYFEFKGEKNREQKGTMFSK